MKWYKQDQHFLIDKNVLNRIIEYGNLTKSDTVLEIGAGFGNLTEGLALKAGKVIAVEKDPELAQSLSRLENVEVIQRDALKVDFPPFNKVISNLPYSISSPVTFKLLHYKFDIGILMYQYEFAKRMVASPNSKEYSRLSIAIQYYAEVEILETVPGTAFMPVPKVRSSVVRLTPRTPAYEVNDEEFFMKLIKAAFSQRRKKLRNAILNNAGLLGIDASSALEKLPKEQINRRAENLSPGDFANVANILSAR